MKKKGSAADRTVMPEVSTAHLILFSRYPEVGKSKTRLIPALGPEGAALLQRRMTEQMLAQITRLQTSFACRAELRYLGGSPDLMAAWLGSQITCLPQEGHDLGERLAQAFAAAFAAGSGRVLIIGADCPALGPSVLSQAFAALDTCELVLGPALDGGYYLIGLKQPQPALFCCIPWGSAEVLAVSLSRAKARSLKSILLEPLADVDRPEDLHHLGDHPKP